MQFIVAGPARRGEGQNAGPDRYTRGTPRADRWRAVVSASGLNEPVVPLYPTAQTLSFAPHYITFPGPPRFGKSIVVPAR